MANAPQPHRSGVPAKGTPAPKQTAAKAQTPAEVDAENAKTVIEKPIKLPPGKPGKAAKPAPPVPDPENAQTVVAEPVVTDEDIVAVEAEDEELKLQTDEPAEDEAAGEKKGKRFRPISRPDDLEGRPTRILETAHYLILGGIVLVVIVIGGAIYMFQGNKALPEKQVTEIPPSQGGPVKTTASPGTAETKTTGTSAKSTDPAKTGDASKSSTPPKVAIDYTTNAANKACFHGCMNFLMWARENALQWTGAQLTAKFKTDVPSSGVNDPDVTGIHTKILGVFNTGLVHPINTSERITFGGSGAHGERQIDADAALKKNNELMGEIRLLTIRLRKRYGDPPEAPAKTTAPDETKTGPGPVGPTAYGPDGKPLTVLPPGAEDPGTAKTPAGGPPKEPGTQEPKK